MIPLKIHFNMLQKIVLIAILSLTLYPSNKVDAVLEDVIDILALTKEVVTAVAGTWKIVEQTQIGNDIDLPFLKRKEQKIIMRMAELSNEIKNTEMMVVVNSMDVMHATLYNQTTKSSKIRFKSALFLHFPAFCTNLFLGT